MSNNGTRQWTAPNRSGLRVNILPVAGIEQCEFILLIIKSVCVYGFGILRNHICIYLCMYVCMVVLPISKPPFDPPRIAVQRERED